MKHYRVTFQPENVSVSIHESATILDAANLAGIILNASCGGRGTCEKCKVNILPDRKSVLACQYHICEDVDVDVPDTAKFYQQKILQHGIDKQIKVDPNVRKIHIPQMPASPDVLLTQLSSEIGNIDSLSKDVISQFKHIQNENASGGITAVLHKLADDSSDTHCYKCLCLEPGETVSTLYGIAVDIGTTTVVAKLIDFSNGKSPATAAAANPQAQYGDDVISRIDYGSTEENLKQMQDVIVNAINTLVDELAVKASITPSDIYEVVIAANTAMNHLFLKLPVKQLGQAPYQAFSLDSFNRTAAQMNLNVNPAANIYTIENIAGFVGADTTAVALAVGMEDEKQMTLVVDIGTNGELILGTSEKMYSASCAAGPALEGARITMGSRAVDGAIEAVIINGGDIDIDVIGSSPPQTICGSGIIDVIAVLLDLGIIDDTGAFTEPEQLKGLQPAAIINRMIDHDGQKAFVLAHNENNDCNRVIVTQKDVRQVQLAKAAIRAGIDLLMKKMSIDKSGIDQILLAGAFGNYISRESACRIGLLPDVPIERIHFVGNAACSGAQMVLLSSDSRQIAGTLARQIEYLELANELEFQTFFADAIMFC